MGLERGEVRQNPTRTVDGGYLYRGVPFRNTPDGWIVEWADGEESTYSSYNSVIRALDGRPPSMYEKNHRDSYRPSTN